MPLLDALFSVGPVRKAIWQLWYPFLTRQLRDEEVLFLNYAFETDPPMGLALPSEEEPNRACIQLYHHVATQADLRGKDVLEVSCGHGGGGAYVSRALRPARYTGLDLNAGGIRFCQQRYPCDRMSFVTGEAAHLPFADGTFDAVLNVEASHCYPDLPRVLTEIARVLRPGGHFLYADFRFATEGAANPFAAWEQELARAPLRELRRQEINAQVRRGMDLNAPRSEALIAKRLPRWLHGLGRDFAGVPGSRVYNALARGELSYRSYAFGKD